MPEFFAGVFIPILLIGLYLLIQKRNITGAFLAAFAVCATALTHPFMLVISMFLIIPYFFYLLCCNNLLRIPELRKIKNLTIFLVLALFLGVGLGMAAYFLFPLLLEIKYFYYGLTKNHLTPNNFLTIKNFFDPYWYYFTPINILPRGFVVNVGFLETLVYLAGAAVTILFFFRKKKEEHTGFLYFAVLSGLLIIFFTTQFSEVFYQYIPPLSGIQFPWRLLTVFLFIPPMILSYLLRKSRSVYLPILFIAFVCIIRFPELYGKNYVAYPDSEYRFTPLNLHATVMNPIWTGRSEDYPIKDKKGEFIDGIGTMKMTAYTNTSRVYEIKAETPSKLVDYTFYFPGWNAYVDGAKANIEYQDPQYRGVITYAVPQGKHKVMLRFEDTKIRLFGKLISVVFLLIFLMLWIFRKRVSKFVFS